MSDLAVVQQTNRAPAPAKTAAGAARRPRLAWLDGMRGIAALCVVYTHFGARVLPTLHAWIYRVFDPGLYGVLVFFLISGYIVPASLERKGSLRTFWIGRLFRLLPLFGLVIGAALLMHGAGLIGPRGLSKNVAAAVLAHLFMLNDLLGENNLIVVIWTLSYEMVFYLLLTALFTVGLHRRSGTFAGIFAVGALLLGGVLPTTWLSGHHHLLGGPTGVALAADILTIGGLALAVVSRGWPRALGAWLAAGTGIVLVAVNGHRMGYEGLTILALMFTGSVLYRAHQGQIGRRHGAIVAGGVFAAVIAAGAWHIPELTTATSQTAIHQQQREWVMSVALAGLTFAIGLALQERRVPRILVWLGLVSYSVYLVFPLLVNLYDDIPFPAAYQSLPWLQAGVSAAFVLILLGCSAATNYLVEAPMQRLGRRVAARLDARGKLTLAAPAVPVRRASPEATSLAS
jgi:peptidoglycan/LPS O-acetylase OafA/YrhL